MLVDAAQLLDATQPTPASPFHTCGGVAETLPEPVDREQYHVRRQARAGTLINEYPLVA
jgi:hypothetical protein